jgi:hypothetical protein
VPERSALTDELLDQLVPVGQVDILVGIPTFNNAATVREVAVAALASFFQYFPRERTALLNCDGGSSDGTPDLVLQAEPKDLDPRVRLSGLRTIHRISAPHGGLPARANAVRAIFAAADLLQAKSVVVLEPTVTNPAPEWIAGLVRPVQREGIDFVAPAFQRHPIEGPLVSQLVRPLVRAVYGCRLREPAAGEFGCSGRLASHCLTERVWDRELAPLGLGLGVCLSAAAGDFRLGQIYLGARSAEPGTDRPHVADVFVQVVGSLLGSLEAHEAYWLAREGAVEVPSFGDAAPAPEESATIDPEPMVSAYRSGFKDLEAILGPILSPETMKGLEASANGAGPLRLPDELWAATVYESAAAYHRQVIHRDHLVKSLVPIYLGRAASFLGECGSGAPAEVDAQLEGLERVFETMKPQLIERWSSKTGGE